MRHTEVVPNLVSHNRRDRTDRRCFAGHRNAVRPRRVAHRGDSGVAHCTAGEVVPAEEVAVIMRRDESARCSGDAPLLEQVQNAGPTSVVRFATWSMPEEDELEGEHYEEGRGVVDVDSMWVHTARSERGEQTNNTTYPMSTVCTDRLA